MIVLPELFMLFYSVFFLLFALSKHKEVVVKYAKGLSLLGLVLALAAFAQRGELFDGAYRVDLFSQVFKVLVAFGLCLVMFMTEGREDTDKAYLPEFCMFLGLSSLGLMMLVSSVELISIVLSLEISSYSLYVIIPLRKDQKKIQAEASMKYLFFGAVSTGIMLYGM